MSDVLTSEQRRRNMSAVKGKDTKPEMIVRRLVHSLGYRYRLHGHKLPGRPDLVFAIKKKVIFVHGCYWHRHSCKLGLPIPRTRTEFWMAKLTGNVKRDAETLMKLAIAGWLVLTIWECEANDRQKLVAKIKAFLN